MVFLVNFSVSTHHKLGAQRQRVDLGDPDLRFSLTDRRTAPFGPQRTAVTRLLAVQFQTGCEFACGIDFRFCQMHFFALIEVIVCFFAFILLL